MKKLIFTALAVGCFSFGTFASVTDTTAKEEMDSAAYGLLMEKMDSLIKALDYKTGQITIQGDLATVTVP